MLCVPSDFQFDATIQTQRRQDTSGGSFGTDPIVDARASRSHGLNVDIRSVFITHHQTSPVARGSCETIDAITTSCAFIYWFHLESFRN